MKRSSVVLLGLVSVLPAFGGLACGDVGFSSGGPTPSAEAYAQCLHDFGTLPSDIEAPPATNTAKLSLLKTSAIAIDDAFRTQVRSDMNRAVDQAKFQTLREKNCSPLLPKSDGGNGNADGAATPSNAGAAGGDHGGAMQVSGTNNQVAGVDEADFIKNDNKYLYIANGSKFRVIDAFPAPQTHQIASVDVPGTARKLFVNGNRAVVYSSLPPEVTPGTTSPPGTQGGYGGGYSAGVGAPSFGTGGGQCTYGYGCSFAGDGTRTAISVFDVTDRAAPILVRTIVSSSSLIAARRIGNAVHTVVGQQQGASISYYGTYPTGLDVETMSADKIAAAFENLRHENDAYIAQLDPGALLPTLKDTMGAVPAAQAFQSDLADGAAFTTVLSIDMTQDTTLGAVTILSRAGAVYGAPDALYIAVPHQRSSGGWYEGVTENEISTVHKFGLGTAPDQTTYQATGVVKGRVLNQFSMDERAGNLRIATTSGHLPDPNAENTLSVLAQQGAGLAVVGKIDGIAKGEDIRSVRFDGDRGYVVTFKKTDPLYVFDLADPVHPKTLSELKIPGFSTYMHLMDATHLLTIGYDAVDHGNFAFFDGVLLQIFDVSDSTNPVLVQKTKIGTRGSSSEALADHLAFNYFAPMNLLAIPMTICEGGGDGSFGTNMTFSGLMVYDVTTAAGFSERGRVAHPSSPTGTGYNSAACSNWWTNASSEVKRSVIMDQYVFSVSESRVKVNGLSALGTDLVNLPLN